MMPLCVTTRAAQEGRGATETSALPSGSAVLMAAFVVIEWRFPRPATAPRMFRLRTVSGSNLSGLFAGVAFGRFFIGTLYLQLVLGYSPISTGVSFLALTLSVVAGEGTAQSLVNRSRRPLVEAAFGALGAHLY